MADLMYLMAFERAPEIGPVEEIDFANYHVTILSSFSLADRNLPIFRAYLRSMMPWFSPITMEVESVETFGTEEEPVQVSRMIEVPSRELQVSGMISKDGVPQIVQLHNSVLDMVELLGGNVEEPHYARDNYVPHISYWLPGVGAQIEFDSMTLVNHRGGFGVDVLNVENFYFGK